MAHPMARRSLADRTADISKQIEDAADELGRLYYSHRDATTFMHTKLDLVRTLAAIAADVRRLG